MRSLYQTVTDAIIAELNRGVIPWRRPWTGQDSLPTNLVSGKTYRGINLFLLSLTSFQDHRWLTMKQVTERGGLVRKGEKAKMVVFWKRWEPPIDPETGEIGKAPIPVLRYYHVFNVEQCERLTFPSLLSDSGSHPNASIERAELLISLMPNPPQIIEGAGAWYRPSNDIVQVPSIGRFKSSDHYYSTLFHELGHATGHQSRLNRSGVTGDILFGSGEYGQEELVAELASAFCCATVGLNNSLISDVASYIDGWLKVLKSDSKAVVVAAAQAQRAADYIRGVKFAS